MNDPCRFHEGQQSAGCPGCSMDGYALTPRGQKVLRDAQQGSGLDGPYYEFGRPVTNLRELVIALDPDMPWYRYNALKSAIRVGEKGRPEYDYQKIEDAGRAGQAMCDVQKDLSSRDPHLPDASEEL